MPRPEYSVPKFGEWDGGEDLSYSIMFDKVRADKDGFIPTPKHDQKDIYLEQQRSKSEKTASNATINRPMETGSICSGGSTPKHTSRHNYEDAIVFNSLHTTRRDQSETLEKGSVNSSLMVSSSQKPMQIVSIKNLTAQEAMARANCSDFYVSKDVLHGRMHRVPGPTRQMYPVYTAGSNLTRSKGGSETSSISDLPEKGNLPKFGDWDVNDARAGEGFSVMFDRARDEKKSNVPQKMPARYVSPVQPAVDLYDKSHPLKKERGRSSIFCCFANTSD